MKGVKGDYHTVNWVNRQELSQGQRLSVEKSNKMRTQAASGLANVRLKDDALSGEPERNKIRHFHLLLEVDLKLLTKLPMEGFF